MEHNLFKQGWTKIRSNSEEHLYPTWSNGTVNYLGTALAYKRMMHDQKEAFDYEMTTKEDV